MIGSLLVGSLFVGSWGEHAVGSANSTKVKKLERQIADLKQKQREAKANISRIEKQKNKLKNEESKLYKEIETLDNKLKDTLLKVAKKEEEVLQTESLARQIAIELLEVEEQIKERDELLKTRVRSMYEFGDELNYLEILFGAESFGELLNRLDFLSLMVQQDNKIIEEFIANKETVKAKKLEIENLLTKLEGQVQELNTLQAKIKQEEKKKSIRIAQINEGQEDLVKLEEEIAENAIRIANEISKANKEIQKLQFDGVFTWPVPSSQRVTSQFGYRSDPFTGKTKGHGGTDIAAPQGTTIVAASGGIVVVAEYLRGYGNTVIIEHGDGIRTLYGHIRNGGTDVKAGDTVKKGQKIAEVGSTGRSTGPHLHFEVHKNGVRVDPMKYLRK
jgi:murein DD-endopeptidase MepM/ murein hydrolase activator NlpD